HDLALHNLKAHGVDYAAPAVGLAQLAGGQSVVFRSHAAVSRVWRVSCLKAKAYFTRVRVKVGMLLALCTRTLSWSRKKVSRSPRVMPRCTSSTSGCWRGVPLRTNF